MTKHPIVHFEIYGSDRQGLATFYGDTFGWQIEDMPDSSYSMVNIGGDGLQGGGIAGQDGNFTGTVVYVQCDDINEGVAKAEANGATVIHPVETIPGMVTFAVLEDPQGNRFGLVDAKVPEAADSGVGAG